MFRTPSAAIGRFRCPVGHPLFHDTGPISQCIVVFPRTAVWIQHEGSRRFLADSCVATIYNRGQRYERFAASADGDRCDWFGVSDAVAREIAGAYDPECGELDRPFRFQWAPSTGRLYYRQRAIMADAGRDPLDVLGIEESVIGVVSSTLSLAYGSRPRPAARGRLANLRHREIAEAARLEIAQTLDQNGSVTELAATLGTSPFHLCRVFRRLTGRTMHEYRTELRLRRSLELLADGKRTVGEIAHHLGFASHSHFVRMLKRHVGETPSMARRVIV